MPPIVIVDSISMSASKKCYYDVLGLTKPSTEDEIRKAYKKMALKHHPDKNPDDPKKAEEKFKEIGEAYAVLSDKDKKAIYDQHGHAGLAPGGSSGGRGDADFGGFGGGGFSFQAADEIFKNFFKGGFFDEDDDFFAGSSFFGNRASNNKGRTRNEHGSPFGDFFGNHMAFSGGFGGGFGGFGSGFTSMSSISSGSGVSKSTTTVRNGNKTITTTKTTKRDSSGQSVTEVHEVVKEGGNQTERRYMIDGQGRQTEMKSIRG
jgi:curved DNA-binding protein CbpA